MKFENNILTVEKTNIKKEKSFGLKFSRKAFNILFNQLYSNKIKAIIRELYSNAYDAHRTANNLNIQPKLHLPTIYLPEFCIRDYGTGIKPKDIDNIYTQVFESTKTDNNDDIGGFGLGSKTPFCYTDNFSVRSFVDGVVYVYSMYINEDGEPTYSLVNKCSTSEPNGLEVKFAVKKEDFQSFINEAAVALEFFSLKPELTGAKFTAIKKEPVFTGSDFYVCKSQDSWSTVENKPIILVGPVAYPIDFNAIKDKLTVYEQYIGKTNIVINANIQDVEVAPNRESLSYNNKTIDFLVGRIKKISNELTDDIINKMSSCKTLFEKRANYQDVVKNLTGCGLDKALDKVKIFGNTGNYGIINLVDIKKKCGIEICRYTKGNLVKRVDNILPSLNIKFVENDGVTTAPNLRTQKLSLSNNVKEVYLIKNIGVQANRDAFKELLGIDESFIIPVSSLPYDKAIVNRSTKKLCRVSIWDSKFGIFKESTIDVKTSEGYYAVIRFSQVFGEDNNSRSISEREFAGFLRSVENCGIVFDKPVYLLRTDAYNKIEKNTKFENVVKYVKNQLLCKNLPKEIWNNINSYKHELENIEKISKQINSNTEFKIASDELITFKNQYSTYSKFLPLVTKLNSLLQKQIDNMVYVNCYERFIARLEKKYDLIFEFNMLDYTLEPKRIKAVAEYINYLN